MSQTVEEAVSFKIPFSDNFCKFTVNLHVSLNITPVKKFVKSPQTRFPKRTGPKSPPERELCSYFRWSFS